MRRHEYDPPVPAGLCRWCSKPLVAVAIRFHGVSIQGINDYEYAHLDGTTECIVRYKPGPYDGWAATRTIERNLAALTDKEEE